MKNRTFRKLVTTAAISTLPLTACTAESGHTETIPVVSCVTHSGAQFGSEEVGRGWDSVDTGLTGRYKNIGSELLAQVNGQPRLGEEYTGLTCDVVSVGSDHTPTVDGVQAEYIGNVLDSGEDGVVFEGVAVVIDSQTPNLSQDDD